MKVITRMTLGASWFESFALLEQIKWILMIPLARKNLSNTIEFANASLDYMTDWQLRRAGNRQRAESVPKRKPPPKLQHQQFRTLVGTLRQRTEREAVPSRGPEFLGLELLLEHRLESRGRVQRRPVGRDQQDQGHITALLPDLRRRPAARPTAQPHADSIQDLGRLRRPINYLEDRTDPIPFVLGEVGSAIGAGHKGLRAPGLARSGCLDRRLTACTP